MKRWALLVVGLYMVVFAALLSPLALIVTAPYGFKELPESLLWPWYRPFWPISLAIVLILGLCQAVLLVVPVKVLSRRPITKRSILWPICSTLLASGLLLAAALVSAAEFLHYTEGMATENYLIGLGIVGLMWMVWTFIFGFYAGKRSKNIMAVAVKSLLAGSIMELLIAIPAHIYCRCKENCYCGLWTNWALATGLGVMLLAFGPAVLVLFVKQCKAITPPATQEPPPE